MELQAIHKLHEGKFLTYYVADYINREGNKKEYEFVSRNRNLSLESFAPKKISAVAMVVFSKDRKRILMQKEFRLACNNWVYNFPAGLIDSGESFEQAAIREIKEETGLDVISVDAVLPPAYSAQGMSDELISLVIVRCDGEISGSCFADEEIEARWFTKEEAGELLKSGAYMSVRTQMFVWQWMNL